MICKKNFRELFRNEFIGNSCCIVGAGPSLNETNPKFFHSMPCFAVNSAILKMEWEKDGDYERFWVSNDALCLRWSYWDRVVSSKCNIVVRDSWLKHEDIIPKRSNFFTARKSNTELDDIDEGLCYCSSVPTCIDMAIKFKFSVIYLFGIDHNESNHGYFWSSWDKSRKPMQVVDYSRERKFLTQPVTLVEPRNQRSIVWNENKKCFDALSIYANSKNVKIYNMNPKSSISSFEFYSHA